MPLPTLISRADLDVVISPSDVDGYADDDSDGVGDAPVLDAIMAAASTRAGELLSGWKSVDDVIQLVAIDHGLRFAIAQIAVGMLARRRKEWANEKGEYPLDSTLRMGEATLKGIAKAERETIAQEAVGSNVLSHTYVNTSSGAPMFGRSSTNPTGRGGF